MEAISKGWESRGQHRSSAQGRADERMTYIRRIAVILVADMVGFSRLAGADEDRTLSRLRGLRSDLMDPAIAPKSDDRRARLLAAEEAITTASSMAPEHAFAHLQMGIVQIFSNRAARGIAECERAPALDRNLAFARFHRYRQIFHWARRGNRDSCPRGDAS
jgi:hypothetical protein